MVNNHGLRPLRSAPFAATVLAGITCAVTWPGDTRADIADKHRDNSGQLPLPSGQCNTPQAATGALLLPLNPGLPIHPDVVAGGTLLNEALWAGLMPANPAPWPALPRLISHYHAHASPRAPCQGPHPMRPLVLSLLLFAASAAASPAEDLAACSTRHAELVKQAATFNGDARIKRLIDADLKRALKEQAEGDGDECIEALDHATKLLAGGA